MHRIIDKIMLYVSCSILYLFLSGITTKSTVLLLVAILAACCNTIVEQIWLSFHERDYSPMKDSYYQIPYTIIVIVTFFLPYSFIFLPVVLYDCYRYKLKIPLILCGASMLWNFHLLQPLCILILLLLCILSVILSDYCNREELLTKQLITQRDTNTEHALLLEAHNKMLLQEQDAAIYTATLQERNRIAREIHDNVGHLLTRSILQMGAIQTINRDESLKEPLSMLNETLNTAMTSIRNSVHDLHDESVDLKAAIQDILSSIDQFEVSLDYDMNGYIAREIKYAFISITKEGINNCLKYSNGNKLHVLLREHPGFYQLMIEDNGTNIQMSKSPGIGISNITERAKSINGTVKILTENGFRILVTVLKGRENENHNNR